MAFSEATKQQIYQKAGGQCQCIRTNCYHDGRCPRAMVVTAQQSALASLLGGLNRYPGFEFHHIQSATADGADSLLNGAFLCIACHRQTSSYGTNLTRSA